MQCTFTGQVLMTLSISVSVLCSTLTVQVVDIVTSETETDHIPDVVTVFMIVNSMSRLKLHLKRVPDFNLEVPEYSVHFDKYKRIKKKMINLHHNKNVACYADVHKDAIFQTQVVGHNFNRYSLRGYFMFRNSTYYLDMNQLSTEFHSSHTEEKEEFSNGSLREDFQLRNDHIFIAVQVAKSPEMGSIIPKVRSLNIQEQLHDIKSHHRFKRQIGPLYIDIIAVVDYYEYEQFLNIYDRLDAYARSNMKSFYKFVFDEADEFYYKYFNMKINLKNIWFIQSMYKSQNTEYKKIGSFIDEDVMLRSFPKEAPLYPYGYVENPDHLMVFTGADLGAIKNGRIYDTEGFAFRGTMCRKDGLSSSLVEDIIGKSRIHIINNVITRIAQSLNAGVDEGICSSGYKMGNVTDMFHPNFFSFSPCTLEDISRFIEKQLKTASGEKCLKEELSPDDYFSFKMLGSVLTLDDQCRMMLGLESSFCTKTTGNTCKVMNCLKPQTQTCVKVQPYSFTYCGSDKVCKEGRCVNFMYPRPDECFRDRNNSAGSTAPGKKCGDIDKQPYLCYSLDVRKHCCLICNLAYSLDSGCEFGDKVDWCSKVSCTQKTYNGLNVIDNCCAKCSFYRRNHFKYSSDKCLHDEMGFKRNNRNCSELIKNEKGFCYFPDNNDKCCNSCRRMSPPIPGCKYGIPQLCEHHASTNVAPSTYSYQWFLFKLFLLWFTLQM